MFAMLSIKEQNRFLGALIKQKSVMEMYKDVEED